MINRADKKNEYSLKQIATTTVVVGAFVGASLQWGMQEVVAHITGVDPSYKMVFLAFMFTGVASMGLYVGSKWYALRKKWFGVHAFLSVVHDSSRGDCGDSEAGHMTEIMKKDNQESETD